MELHYYPPVYKREVPVSRGRPRIICEDGGVMSLMKKLIGAFWAAVVAAALSIVLLFFAELTPLPVYGCHLFHSVCIRFIMMIIVSIAAEYLTTQSFQDLLLDLAIAAGLALISASWYPLKQTASLSDKFAVLAIPGFIMASLAGFVGKAKREAKEE